MRKLALASSLVLALTFAATPLSVSAASADQTVSITFYGIQFTSLLGGTSTGNAYVEGPVNAGELGELKGTANLPLRDQRLSLAPTGTIVLAPQQILVGWNRWQCDQFGCIFSSGTSTFERQSAQGLVDIRLGTMRGTGTLSAATDAVCVADCPPPGASYWTPTGYSQVYNAAVLGSQDAGYVNLNGPAPIIR